MAGSGDRVTLRTREGTMVTVRATPFDRAEYAGRRTGCNGGYGLPPDGTTGIITPLRGSCRPRASRPGPGGGLVYVRFYKASRGVCHIGVPPQSLRKVDPNRRGLRGCSCP